MFMAIGRREGGCEDVDCARRWFLSAIIKMRDRPGVGSREEVKIRETIVLLNTKPSFYDLVLFYFFSAHVLLPQTAIIEAEAEAMVCFLRKINIMTTWWCSLQTE